MTLAILAVSPQGIQTAKPILSNYPDARLFSTHPGEGVEHIDHIQSFVAEQFTAFEGWIFIGAMGICVRSIAPLIGHKYTDPASDQHRQHGGTTSSPSSLDTSAVPTS